MPGAPCGDARARAPRRGVHRCAGRPPRLGGSGLGRAAGPLREGERFVLDSEQTGARVRTALPGERLADLCADTAAAARVNRLEGERIFPGMRVVLPRGDPKERQR